MTGFTSTLLEAALVVGPVCGVGFLCSFKKESLFFRRGKNQIEGNFCSMPLRLIRPRKDSEIPGSWVPVVSRKGS